MPRNIFIDDEVHCSDDDRSVSGTQCTDSYKDNDDFINDSSSEEEENEIYDVPVHGNNDQYCDIEVGNDDDAMSITYTIDEEISREDTTMEENNTPFVLTPLTQHECEDLWLICSRDDEIMQRKMEEEEAYWNNRNEMYPNYAPNTNDDEKNACNAVDASSYETILMQRNAFINNNENDDDEDHDASHRVLLYNDFDVNSECDGEEHHWTDMVGYRDPDENAAGEEEEARKVSNEMATMTTAYVNTVYNTQMDVVNVNRENVEEYHRPISNEASHERSMHKYLANGTFSDKSFFVQTFEDILISKKSHSHKIQIPFEECVYCKGLYVKSISKMTNGFQLYRVASQKHKCCENGKRLLQEEDVLNLSKFDDDERMREFYTHPKLHVFANRLNTEFCLHAPVIAQDNARGYTKFEYGLHGLRFNGKPISRCINQGTRHNALQGVIYEKDIALRFTNTSAKTNENDQREYEDHANVLLQWLVRHNLFYKKFSEYRHLLTEQTIQALPIKELHFQTVEPMSNNCVALIQDIGTPSLQNAMVIIPPTRDESNPSDFGYPQCIDENHAFWEAVHFVLLNPYGLPSANNTDRRYTAVNARGIKTKELTLLDYVRCKILQKSLLQDLGTLFQRYVLHSWLRCEDNALKFEYLTSLKRNGSDRTKPILLSDKRLGSRKFQRKTALNALAIAQRIGMAHLFFTMTCNPNAEEIREKLKITQNEDDRFDLICMYFHSQNLLLRSLIESGHLFGRKPAYVLQVIEFQNRGLPHSHTIVAFGGDEITKEEIDEYVSAGFDEGSTKDDRDLVCAFMIHKCTAKCKESNEKTKGKCKYGYPKEECKKTVLDEHGYATYKRQNNFPDENLHWRNIVPHNLALLKLFNCHINVEWVGSQNSIAYLFSYAFKGVDYVNVYAERTDNDQINEIREYQKCRSISGTEAFWRIMQYPINYMSVSVSEIKAFLEHEVHLSPGLSDIERYFNRPRGALFDNLLILKFYEMYITADALPNRNDTVDGYSMNSESPPKYVYRRQTGKLCIYRLKTYNAVAQAERYYLRKLLMNIPARSYSDFKEYFNPDTRTMEYYNTYQEACRARNLIIGNDVNYDCLSELCKLGYSPADVRSVFCSLLIYSGNEEMQCSFPDLLKKNVQFLDKRTVTLMEYMSHDALVQLVRTHGITILHNQLREHSIEYAKRRIYERFKQLENRDCKLFGMSEYESDYKRKLYSLYFKGEYDTDVEHRVDLVARERSELQYNFKRMRETIPQRVATLNLEQRACYQEIIKSTQSNDPIRKNVFIISARAGTGKTHLLKLLADTVRSSSLNEDDFVDENATNGERIGIVLCVASTGLASLLYEGGSTAHNAFGIPVTGDYESEFVSQLSAKKKIELLKNSRMILWDECLGSHIKAIECVSNLLKLHLPNGANALFGGITVVLVGDVRQCGPIIPETCGLIGAKKASLLGQNRIRNNATILRLNEQMRAAEDEEFGRFLTAIGEGSIGDNVSGEPHAKIITERHFRDAFIPFDYTRGKACDETFDTNTSCKTRINFSHEENVFFNKVFPNVNALPCLSREPF